jgi:alpha-galactosidase
MTFPGVDDGPTGRISAGAHDIVITGDLGGFQLQAEAVQLEPGVFLVEARIDAPQALPAPCFRIAWTHPAVDIHASWETSSGCNRGIRVDWGAPALSKATSAAPVVCLHSSSGRNGLTLACSEVLRVVYRQAAIHEESGEFHCYFEFFREAHPRLSSYAVSVRIDARSIPFFHALRDVADWWAGLPACTPSPVPEAARRPMYSTWYSFHQELEAKTLLRECELARELGCETVVVDDGWQTMDRARGYAYCGDWEPERLPDMAGLVKRVHGLGMKFILWYSVPFVGLKSKTFARFGGRYLAIDPRKQAALLDPRYPQVRDYLIDTYEAAVRNWNIDGFKLDFVDAFPESESAPQDHPSERDVDSVEEGADILLADVMTRLRQIKPEIMIEFRQSYVGPSMRKYGNIFRVGDCPLDGIRNRTGALDLRLLAGGTATHSDMLMWHPDDSVESAALQLLNILFAVPQISVRLDRQPAAHREMLRFWLRFWNEHRETLLDGELTPLHPELLYPAVIASTGRERVIAAYASIALPLDPPLPDRLFIVNATRGDRVLLESPLDAGAWQASILDCRGNALHNLSLRLAPGVQALAIPPAGLAIMTRA